MLLLLTACFSRPVADVPEDAVKIAVTARGIAVDGDVVAPFSDLETDPTDDDVPSVGEALTAFAGRPGWIELPGETAFFAARKVINASRRAGLSPLVLSERGGERAYALARSPKYGIGGPCPDGPREIDGTQPLVTFWIQTGPDGSWLLAEARHLPVVGGEPTDFLPPGCLQAPDCSTIFDGARQAVCAGDSGPQEVRLGGESSACLVPIAKTPKDARKWSVDLGKHVARLGLAEQSLTKVVPEAQSPVSALVATLEGFRRGGASMPAVGTTVLVEGNDGPLDCVRPAAVMRTADDLADSGARYLGSLRDDP